MGAFQHLTRPESKWAGNDNDVARAHLQSFLEGVGRLLWQMDSTFSTNLNERVDSLKNGFAPRARSWKCSCCCTVLQFNYGHARKLRVYDELASRFGWPVLGDLARRHLLTLSESTARQKAQRATPRLGRIGCACVLRTRPGSSVEGCRSSKGRIPGAGLGIGQTWG
jgi:hypothetical protein